VACLGHMAASDCLQGITSQSQGFVRVGSGKFPQISGGNTASVNTSMHLTLRICTEPKLHCVQSPKEEASHAAAVHRGGWFGGIDVVVVVVVVVVVEVVVVVVVVLRVALVTVSASVAVVGVTVVMIVVAALVAASGEALALSLAANAAAIHRSTPRMGSCYQYGP